MPWQDRTGCAGRKRLQRMELVRRYLDRGATDLQAIADAVGVSKRMVYLYRQMLRTGSQNTGRP